MGLTIRHRIDREGIMSNTTDYDTRPTRVQVKAAQMLVDRFERGLAPEPGEEIRRLAKMTPKPDWAVKQ